MSDYEMTGRTCAKHPKFWENNCPHCLRRRLARAEELLRELLEEVEYEDEWLNVRAFLAEAKEGA